MKRVLFIISSCVLVFSSCKKDSETTYISSTKGSLSVEFDNVAGSADLQKDSAWYKNLNGDSLKVTKLKYFVSNFVFTKVDGSSYTDTSYHLIVEGDTTTVQPEFQVPEGEYSKVSFVLGVDSIRNTSTTLPRTGDLDVVKNADMYWGWNSGYIFYKLEGTSPKVPSMGGMGKTFMYHIGLTTPTVNNVKTVTLDLTARGTAKVKSGKETNIHLLVDVLKMFSGTNTINIATNSMVMSDPFSAKIAENFVGMFSHGHTEN